MVDPPRHDVVGRQDAERHGTDHGEQRAPDGDLQGDDHFRGVQPPVREVGREEVFNQREDVARLGNQGHGAHFRPPPRPDEKRQRDGQPTRRSSSIGRLRGGDRANSELMAILSENRRYGPAGKKRRGNLRAAEAYYRDSLSRASSIFLMRSAFSAAGISALACSLLFSRNSSS